jgi:hypothetical protein
MAGLHARRQCPLERHFEGPSVDGAVSSLPRETILRTVVLKVTAFRSAETLLALVAELGDKTLSANIGNADENAFVLHSVETREPLVFGASLRDGRHMTLMALDGGILRKLTFFT